MPSAYPCTKTWLLQYEDISLKLFNTVYNEIKQLIYQVEFPQQGYVNTAHLSHLIRVPRLFAQDHIWFN